MTFLEGMLLGRSALPQQFQAPLNAKFVDRHRLVNVSLVKVHGTQLGKTDDFLSEPPTMAACLVTLQAKLESLPLVIRNQQH